MFACEQKQIQMYDYLIIHKSTNISISKYIDQTFPKMHTQVIGKSEQINKTARKMKTHPCL
jgi:hypothetical protein